ncbi:MAG: DUF1015 family protein [Saprospiraceae bacterium]|nr:DUF1015 family protein [Saprospiraceae bacterium]
MKIFPFLPIFEDDAKRHSKVVVKDPAIVLQRLTGPNGIFGGIIALSSVEGLEDGSMLPHEHILKERFHSISGSIRQQKKLSEPVLLGYPRHDVIASLCDQWIESHPPDVSMGENPLQDYWIINDPTVLEKLILHFGDVDRTYVADGHHRLGAMQHLHQQGWLKQPYLMTALYSFKNLLIHPYHRMVRLSPSDQKALLLEMRTYGEVTEISQDLLDNQAHDIVIQTDGAWLGFDWNQEVLDQKADDEHALLASVFTNVVLTDILQIKDVATSDRIRYFPHNEHNAMVAAVRSDPHAIGFYLTPVHPSQFMEYCEHGRMMPPKSTYFTPRMPAGAIHQLLDT